MVADSKAIAAREANIEESKVHKCDKAASRRRVEPVAAPA